MGDQDKGGGGGAAGLTPQWLQAGAAGGQSQGVMVQGYLQEGGAGGRSRLYFSTQLNQYIEFAPEDVLNAQQVQDDPLGASMVWLRPDATINYVQSTPTSASSWVQGNLSSSAWG